MANDMQVDQTISVQPLDFDAVKAREHALLGLAPGGADAGATRGAGLALSGGGIRSATFGLGVLQALAAREALGHFDYLSTVSGGGYIGAWLSAWIQRAGLEQVQAALGRAGGGAGPAPHTLEPEQVSWLRRYSNYLTPRVGLFSVDSLTLISIWTRNVTLSLIIVLAFFAVLLLLPRLALLYVTGVIDAPPVALGYLAGLLGGGIFPAVLVANMVELERPPGAARFRLATTPAVLWTVLLPGILAALSGSFWLFGPDQPALAANRAVARWTAAWLLLVGLGWLACKLYHALRYADGRARTRRVRTALLESAVFLPSGAAGIAAGMGVLALVHGRVGWETGTAHAAAVLTFGPALFLLVFGAGGSIFVGLVGRNYFERSREWWSRMNAWFLIIGTGWLTLHGCAFYLPALAEWAYVNAGPWLRGMVGAGWLASVAGLLLTPRQGDGDPRRRLRWLTVAKLAAALFLLGFVAAAASLTDCLLVSAGRLARTAVALPAGVAELDWHVLGPAGELSQRIDVPAGGVPALGAYVAARLADLHGLLLAGAGPVPFLWLAFAVTVAVLLVFGLRVDVNKFSLHNMYKTRLIRCYLGASNPRRHAQPFTGFDDGDDVPLSSLAGGAALQRPMHIINATLNLSQGKNLAWQERKAASFTLTALYSGFALGHTQGVSSEQQARARLVQPERALAGGDDALAGYRPTRLYAASNGETREFTLGMAAATSGAAASPNMGAATSPALAFLMTLLNVRIGRWSPNPARRLWQRASPRFGLLCLLQELFGYSNDESAFVYLSDGGHFDNTGIYELVRRRCRLILLVDASEDSRRGFDDLGRAIRQCRIDFGVDIRIDLGALRAGPGAPGLPACGYAKGEILYGSGAAEGELLYLKPTLCAQRREPVDVLNYSSNHPSFPHQSPADQFFDESQFESYRQLGLHIAGACLDQHLHLLHNASSRR
ncbi:MAG TPA: patatin-like phospholipase family protein [Burkholderiaceae bacterium]|nr:patatin-like phospholipase family protein [Burkholderiaceae bacterium]